MSSLLSLLLALVVVLCAFVATGDAQYWGGYGGYGYGYGYPAYGGYYGYYGKREAGFGPAQMPIQQ